MKETVEKQSVGGRFEIADFFDTQSRRPDGRRLRLSKNHVIASQCAHWRGNLPDFQTFPYRNCSFLLLFRGSPHQPAGWFAMTFHFRGFFDTLSRRPDGRRLLFSSCWWQNAAFSKAVCQWYEWRESDASPCIIWRQDTHCTAGGREAHPPQWQESGQQGD